MRARAARGAAVRRARVVVVASRGRARSAGVREPVLDNGLRHTPAGTEIRVAVERRNGDAILEVSDDGPGIPEGMDQQVFSRFVRGAGPADVAGDTGTGLGLAIVKAVATSHGGDVQAGASDSGGARFVIRLPAA